MFARCLYCTAESCADIHVLLYLRLMFVARRVFRLLWRNCVLHETFREGIRAEVDSIMQMCASPSCTGLTGY